MFQLMTNIPIAKPTNAALNRLRVRGVRSVLDRHPEDPEEANAVNRSRGRRI